MGADIAVGVGQGFLLGGTDGVHTRTYGGAVDAALRWLAVAPLPEDVRVGRANMLAHVGGWLCGTGVAVDASVVAASDAAFARRPRSPETLDVAADPRQPRGFDVHRVVAMDDEHGVVFVRVPGATGGFEALRFRADDWRTLLDRDGELRRGELSNPGLDVSQPPRPTPVTPVGRAMSSPDTDETRFTPPPRDVTPSPGEVTYATPTFVELGEEEDTDDLPTALQPLYFLPGARPVPPGPAGEGDDEDEAWDLADHSSIGSHPRPTSPAVDVKYLLQGYAWCVHGEQAWFGRPVAGRFVDLHTYAWVGDAEESYRAFLTEKASAGFTPRLERSGPIPSGAATAPLDADVLAQAWRHVAGR
jgi:hypothetical protein